MRAAVKAVVNAWAVSGPHPEWPTLQAAITNLVHAYDTEAAS